LPCMHLDGCNLRVPSTMREGSGRSCSPQAMGRTSKEEFFFFLFGSSFVMDTDGNVWLLGLNFRFFIDELFFVIAMITDICFYWCTYRHVCIYPELMKYFNGLWNGNDHFR